MEFSFPIQGAKLIVKGIRTAAAAGRLRKNLVTKQIPDFLRSNPEPPHFHQFFCCGDSQGVMFTASEPRGSSPILAASGHGGRLGLASEQLEQ